jgi:hypothetical protein
MDVGCVQCGHVMPEENAAESLGSLRLSIVLCERCSEAWRADARRAIRGKGQKVNTTGMLARLLLRGKWRIQTLEAAGNPVPPGNFLR